MYHLGMSRSNVISRLNTLSPKGAKKSRLAKVSDDGYAVPMTEAQLRAQRERDEAREKRKLDIAETRMSPLFEKYSGKITQAQMLFVHYVVFNSLPLEEAVMLAFPRTQTWTEIARRKRAYNLLNPNKNRVLVAYYDDLRAEFISRMDEEQTWTKGMATKELKEALSASKESQKREGITKDNAGMRISAIQELDRIHGLHKVDVNLGTKPVVFAGEDELSDDVPTSRPDLENAIEMEAD